MKLKVLIFNKSKIMLSENNLKKLTKGILTNILPKNKNKNIYEISLLFVNKNSIKNLKNKYFQKNETTDVIAFPQNDFIIKKNYKLLGDVVICPEVVFKQAEQLQISDNNEELTRVLIHGILHLLGYSDKNEVKRKQMFEIQERILKVVIGRAISGKLTLIT